MRGRYLSQRNYQRRPVMIPIEFQVHGIVHDGLVINKSKTGIFIKTGIELSVGDDIVVNYPFSKFGGKKREGAAFFKKTSLRSE